jgi:hypothetical protein
MASPVAIADAESSPLRHTHVARSFSSPLPPLPAQTTRILTTEAVATSKMHLGRMFREWFPEFDVRWLSSGVSIE